ncbi:gamma-glutamyltranspeptidase [Elysia marginata]|uniref:Gamma-glutamyltranspeptidase n=1 Tax=Elysia marginata TaxID=1093978 RepID=A0AAV4G6F4_9GAST|nr:gamma-glutamyltranspeptidase [Elysia marginata]
MVVSARKEASDIGLSILKKGGNAFDAMVATQLALAVAYPVAGNIGGGGFMVYRKANGDVGSLDYREKAPLKASSKMYLDKAGNIIKDMSTFGAMSVGVPGTIAGIFAVHKRFGSLPLKMLIEPVIFLAERGVVVTKKQRKRLENYSADLKRANGTDFFLTQGFQEGDTIKYDSLANTLKQILKNGRDDFYKGDTSKKLVAYIQNEGGIISQEDLENYQAKWRPVVTFRYKDLKIISMSPPSSGGITLAQIMKMIEPFPLSKYGHNDIKTIQVITEAERRAYADRNFFLGDPDFVSIPINQLLDSIYLSDRMKDFSFQRATKSDSISHGSMAFLESNETTHYSIVDSFGNAVSVTTTLNGNYGSKLYCNSLGFFLNNEMDDFSAKKGIPNQFGLTGGEANSIAPEKRMLSSMTPTIVERAGKLYMVVGSPGGATIITSVLQTILNVYEFGMNMQEAVSAPRFHHQWLPDHITLESDSFSKQIKDSLKILGYKINEKNTPIGKVDAILLLKGLKKEGGADPRGDDATSGY